MYRQTVCVEAIALIKIISLHQERAEGYADPFLQEEMAERKTSERDSERERERQTERERERDDRG